MAYFETPQSQNEALLKNIIGANNAILPPESRNEKLLQAILGVEGMEPELPPQSRIEKLLYLIYLQGEGGGGGAEPFIANYSKEENKTICDKTYSEIVEAIAAGKTVIAKYIYEIEDGIDGDQIYTEIYTNVRWMKNKIFGGLSYVEFSGISHYANNNFYQHSITHKPDNSIIAR